ncbi:MAG: copper resistance CopC family protein [Thermaerobacterales bacterium]
MSGIIGMARPVCRRPRAVILAGGMFLVYLWVANPVGVEAHVYLTDSQPQQGDVIETPLETFQAVFSEAIVGDASQLTLLDAAGRQMSDTSQTALSDLELQLAFPPLEPGRYQIEWEVLAVDGHVTTGTVGFELVLGAEPAPEPADDAAGADESETGAEPVSRAQAPPPVAGHGDAAAAPDRAGAVWLVAAAALAVAGGGLLVGFRSRR